MRLSQIFIYLSRACRRFYMAAAYEIKSAMGRVIGSQAQWEPVDLKKYPLDKLYKRYNTIRATLFNKYTKKSGVITVDDYETELRANETFFRYLDRIGEKGFKLTPGSTEISKSGLLYKEALSNRFKIVPVRKGLLPDGDFSDKYIYNDLFVTKKGVNPVELQKYTLFTVNGYVHQTDANSKGLWVEDGYKTIKKRKKHCIGVISFENLGALKQVPIRKEMISKLNDKVSLYHECVIDIGEDCSDKTIILIIGGFMHVLDYEVFSRISDSAVKVKLKNVPLLERIHLSNDDLDYGDTLFDKKYGETNLILTDVYSDDFIKKYLTLSYSFIVLLDNTEVFRDITYPRMRGIPNNYLTEYKPKLPMMTRLGKFEEYVTIKDGDTYVLETADCQYRPRLYNKSWPLTENSYYNDARQPTDRYRIPSAYFFNLLTLVKK